MTASRDPQRTRRRILDAAQAAFAAHGPAGARVDRIASAAGVNKRMLYHYFGNKDGLFAAVLEDALGRIDLGTGDIAERLRALGRSRDMLRLWTWESLDGSAAVDPSVWGRFYDQLRSAVGFPEGQEALALLAVAMVPGILAPLSARVTGLDPQGSEFAVAHEALLERLAELLSVVSGTAASTSKPALGGSPEPAASSAERPRFRYRWPAR